MLGPFALSLELLDSSPSRASWPRDSSNSRSHGASSGGTVDSLRLGGRAGGDHVAPGFDGRRVSSLRSPSRRAISAGGDGSVPSGAGGGPLPRRGRCCHNGDTGSPAQVLPTDLEVPAAGRAGDRDVMIKAKVVAAMLARRRLAQVSLVYAEHAPAARTRDLNGIRHGRTPGRTADRIVPSSPALTGADGETRVGRGRGRLRGVPSPLA